MSLCGTILFQDSFSIRSILYLRTASTALNILATLSQPMHEDGIAPDSGEKMRYGVLGDDALKEQDKLEKYSGTVDWQYLKTHFEKGVILYVDASLQLTEVGKAIATDKRSQVDRWLKTGDLLKPGPPHAEHWESTQAKFTAMVVSPFILIQPLAERNR